MRTAHIPFLAWASALVVVLVQPVRADDAVALLVGCSDYEILPAQEDLWSPVNDVPLVADLLVERFGFPRSAIAQLAGWPADVAARPTAANIRRHVERMIAASHAGTRVAILLSGHGAQVPIPTTQTDPMDPTNPEPDGLDEVFLPADVQRWSGTDVAGAIRDDEIGRWLDAFRQKGAVVWLILDCCHSGTMMRSATERYRSLRPDALGIPAALLAARTHSSGSAPAEPPLAARAGDSGPGSVVAFYAAQAHETAPEMPRPPGAPQEPSRYHSLLSYTLVKLLRRDAEPVSYRELVRGVLGEYHLERGARQPTPFAEGDLDRPVLASDRVPAETGWPVGPRDGRLVVSGGVIHGLEVGTILELHDGRGERIGFARVVAADLSSAVLAGCEHEGHATPTAERLNAARRGHVAQRAWHGARVGVAVGAELDGVRERLAARLATDHASGIALVETIEAAQLAIRRDGARYVLEQRADDTRFAVLASHAATDDLVRLAEALAVDLARASAWTAYLEWLGRLAASDKGPRVALDVDRIGAAAGPVAGTLRDGDAIRIRVRNDSATDVWVSLLQFQADRSISVVLTEGLPARRSLQDINGKIDAAIAGAEGLVLVAFEMQSHRARPDFSRLEQPPIGKPQTVTRGTGTPPEGLVAGLEQLLVGRQRREMRSADLGTVRVVARTWRVAPRTEGGR